MTMKLNKPVPFLLIKQLMKTVKLYEIILEFTCIEKTEVL